MNPYYNLATNYHWNWHSQYRYQTRLYNHVNWSFFLAKLTIAFCNIFFSDHFTKIAKNYLRTYSPRMQQFWPLLLTDVSATKCLHLQRCTESQKWRETGFELELRQTNSVCCRKFFRISWRALILIWSHLGTATIPIFTSVIWIGPCLEWGYTKVA